MLVASLTLGNIFSGTTSSGKQSGFWARLVAAKPATKQTNKIAFDNNRMGSPFLRNQVREGYDICL
jgi:hypothetical protein